MTTPTTAIRCGVDAKHELSESANGKNPPQPIQGCWGRVSLRRKKVHPMKIIEIAFTVLPVSSLKKARAFYEGALGLKPSKVFEKDEMGMVEYDIGAGTLAIGCGAPLFKPSEGGGAIALEVEDFGAAIDHLKRSGCTFSLEATETPVCRMAVVTDPDGNFLMIHKRKG